MRPQVEKFHTMKLDFKNKVISNVIIMYVVHYNMDFGHHPEAQELKICPYWEMVEPLKDEA